MGFGKLVTFTVRKKKFGKLQRKKKERTEIRKTFFWLECVLTHYKTQDSEVEFFKTKDKMAWP